MKPEPNNSPVIAGFAGAPLLACPFCGGDAEADTLQGFRRMKDGNISTAVAIYCTKCTVQMSMCRDDFPEYQPDDLLTILTDAWNCRQANAPHELPPTKTP